MPKLSISASDPAMPGSNHNIDRMGIPDVEIKPGLLPRLPAPHCNSLKLLVGRLQHNATRKRPRMGPKSLILLVAEEGLEPPTRGL